MSGENGKNKKKISFLVIYAASLLTIALVLLLLSYFQQRRANEQIGSLEAKHDIFSTSALQSIDGMRESLVELEAKNKELEESLESVQSENNSLRTRNSELEVEVGLVALLVGGVHEPLAALAVAADAHAGERPLEGHAAHGEGGRCRQHADGIHGVHLIGHERHGHDLHLVAEALREGGFFCEGIRCAFRERITEAGKERSGYEEKTSHRR